MADDADPRLTDDSDYLMCDHCGDEAIVSESGLFGDGDGGACQSCGFPGAVSCDDETEPWWNTSQDDGARCNRLDCYDCRMSGKAVEP